MKILVVGATGATGRHLVQQLLDDGNQVVVIVRSASRLTDRIKNHENAHIIEKTLLEMSDDEMIEAVKGCDAVASCLGHTINFKGMFGKPRKLVTDATKRLCLAIQSHSPQEKVKYVLMNSCGVRNNDLKEEISMAEHAVIFLVRLLIPPHSDNEQAAEYLRMSVGTKDQYIEWCAVRPVGLINEDVVTPYELFPSPIRSAIFDASKVSRINVGHSMAELITNADLWSKWKSKMPVLYSRDEK